MKELKSIFKLTIMEKKDVALAVLFGFIAGIAGVALLASSGYLVSKAALTSQMTTLVVMAACLKLFGFVSALSRYAERLYSHRATFTMLSNLRVSFFERLSPLAPNLFQRYRSGDLLARIVGDVESLQNFLLRVFYPPVVLAIVFLSTIFFASFFSATVALVLFIGFLLTVVVVPALFAWQKRKTVSRTRASRAALSTEATEFLYGFRDLKIYQQLEEKEGQLQRLVDAYAVEQRNEGQRENYSQSANAFVAMLVSLVVLGLGAYFVAVGELEGLYLAMLVMLSLAVFENVTPMAVFPAYYEESRKAASRLDKVVEEPVQNEGEKGLQPGHIGITLKDVSYTYPQEERPALNNVSLNLPPGSKTAIVGPSGSGKSTLLQVLLHILQTDSGSVLVNGEDINHFDQEKLWSRTNVVLQENHFFFGTIRSNLAIASEEATDEQMKSVLEKVELDAFPLSMKVEEKGQNLSGGEKQRLAIARAMLKGEALWLLDEPVSSIDSMTAKSIYSRLFEQGKEDTFVVISHDLSGLEQLDQIIVMEQGRIVEMGSYKNLMERRGYFYGLKKIEKSVFA
ncbi:thiol reductant ABC exporter subunit CydC [Planomicrobium sp. CPCC 101079]|uniref:thiol reductant ABC exporter subunit CydC n=1 Tax=Planomicrobium sp. CPCC 101079 TaxID=2599618 RepID=UPI0011B7F37F|nr:thiol reductant ABC exporter subunit CydC [Planomicrobium sp. CPCC 101079]TWT02294.1 thiol reductant ABC exporter subunit CydC [Planomicrobium sp. CPCC 101079]